MSSWTGRRRWRVRRTSEAVRGLRLARDPGRGRQRHRAIEAAINEARDDDRPSLIAVRTHIGYGSPNKQDSQKAHGSPLGPDEVRLTKEAYGWDPDRTFYVPADALSLFRQAVTDGERRYEEWNEKLARYAEGHVDVAEEFLRRVARTAPAGLGRRSEELRRRRGDRDPERLAGRDQRPRPAVPELFGGAADLSESNLTDVKGDPQFSADEPGPEPAVRRPRARHGRCRRTASPTTAGSSRTTRRS